MAIEIHLKNVGMTVLVDDDQSIEMQKTIVARMERAAEVVRTVVRVAPSN